MLASEETSRSSRFFMICIYCCISNALTGTCFITCCWWGGKRYMVFKSGCIGWLQVLNWQAVESNKGWKTFILFWNPLLYWMTVRPFHSKVFFLWWWWWPSWGSRRSLILWILALTVIPVGFSNSEFVFIAKLHFGRFKGTMAVM